MSSRTGDFAAWIVWVLASVFSLFQFFLQVASSMMTQQYAQAFHLSHAGVGFLSSVFFYTYVLVQVPAGLFLDHFNVRKVLLTAIFIMAIGCVLFGWAPTLSIAIFARILMGLGGGFAFVGMVFISAERFPRAMFAFLVGLGEFVGMFGSALGVHFVPHIIMNFGWRDVMVGSGVLALVLFALMWGLLKDCPHRVHHQDPLWATIWVRIKRVAPNPVPWLSGLVCCGMFAVVSAFASLWGVPFLQHTYHFDYYTATSAMAFALFGMAVGGPLIGAISARLHTPRLFMFFCCLMALLFALILITAGPYEKGLSQVLLFMMGFFASSYVLAFALVEQHCKPELKGTGIGICNMMALMGAIFLQPLTGVLLTHFKTIQLPVAVSFRYGVMVLPGVMVVALLAVIALSFVKQSGHESG